jgi:hypothetical protein
MRRSIARATWEMQLVIGGRLTGVLETVYVNGSWHFAALSPLLCG